MSIYLDHRTKGWLENTNAFPPEDFMAAFGIRNAEAGFCYAAWNLFHERNGQRFSKLDVREAIKNGTISTGPVKRSKIE